MSLEDELLKQRLSRIREIEALGYRPYGSRYDFTHTVPQILAEYGPKTAEELVPEVRVRVAGRLMAIRHMGKAGFAHVQQNGERLQFYVKKDAVGERDFQLFKMLDIGDFIGVEGYLFRTRTGELSIHAEKLEFLSKTLLSMPEKWHGLEDVEVRYRQRYLDLIANPDVRKVFVTRAKIVSSLRRQLEAKGFIEVETPMMQPLYGGAAARPFVTHHNTLDIDLYLRIAPELYLKRLVVGGLERVFEINRNFRNEGLSKNHNPEFTMLEFYQAYTDYEGLMDFTAELLKQTALDANGTTTVEFEGHTLDFGKFERYTMREAVVHFWEGEDRPTLEDVANPEWLRGALAVLDRPANSSPNSSRLTPSASSFSRASSTTIPWRPRPSPSRSPATPHWWTATRLSPPGWRSATPSPNSTTRRSSAAASKCSSPCASAATKRHTRWMKITCEHSRMACRLLVGKASASTA